MKMKNVHIIKHVHDLYVCTQGISLGCTEGIDLSNSEWKSINVNSALQECHQSSCHPALYTRKMTQWDITKNCSKVFVVLLFNQNNLARSIVHVYGIHFYLISVLCLYFKWSQYKIYQIFQTYTSLAKTIRCVSVASFISLKQTLKL